MTITYVVELQEGVYLTNAPNLYRTTLFENAKRYKTLTAAKRALSIARKFRPFKGAFFVLVKETVK